MVSENKKQIIFLILISIFIVLLVITLVILIKDRNLISKNGIIYEIEKNNFSYCSCMSDKGIVTYSNNLNISTTSK